MKWLLSVALLLIGCDAFEAAVEEGLAEGAPAASRYQSCVREAVPVYAGSASPSPMVHAEGIAALCKEAAGLISPLASPSFEAEREALDFMEKHDLLTPESRDALEATRILDEYLKDSSEAQE